MNVENGLMDTKEGREKMGQIEKMALTATYHNKADGYWKLLLYTELTDAL